MVPSCIDRWVDIVQLVELMDSPLPLKVHYDVCCINFNPAVLLASCLLVAGCIDYPAPVTKRVFYAMSFYMSVCSFVFWQALKRVLVGHWCDWPSSDGHSHR